MSISKSKRQTNAEDEVDGEEKPATQENFDLHECLYESIDDSHLDTILLPHTLSSNLETDNISSSSESITNCSYDQARYLQPFDSLSTKESSCHREEQSQSATPTMTKTNRTVIQSLCIPYSQTEADTSGYEISRDCTYDRASYLQRNNTLVDKTSYCHISDVEKS